MKAVIKQGLINVSVKLKPTIKSSYYTSGFNQFCGCGSRVRQKLVCEKEQKELSRDEIQKGYTINKDTAVMFSKDELKNLESDNNSIIELFGFEKVSKDKLISFLVYGMKSYYVDSADKQVSSIFEMFKQALQQEQVIGKVKLTNRNKEHLGVLLVVSDLMYFVELPFIDSMNEFKKTDYKVKDDEVKFARDYIQENINKVNVLKLENTQEQKKQELIEKKLKGETIEISVREYEKPKDNPFKQALKVKAK